MELNGQLHAPAPLPPGKSPRYPLDRLGGLQSHSGHGGEEKIPSPCRESNSGTPIVQLVAQRYADWAIPRKILINEDAHNFSATVHF
jgi:hypothetical protein